MISINFSGDILPGSLPYYIGINYTKHFNVPFNKNKFHNDLAKAFGDADVNYINLESPVIKDHNISMHKSFAGGKYFIDFLKEYNIKYVSLANNHINEHNNYGIDSTIDLLQENNITFTGVVIKGKNKLGIIVKDDLRIGLLSFSNVPVRNANERIPRLTDKDIHLINDLFKENSIDFKIIIIHWGDEYIHFPSYEQVTLGRVLIDSGINVIIGHHPHVIQPIEKYKNGLIFYSLGNCIFGNLFSKKVRLGIIVQLKIKNKFDYDYEVVPIYLNHKNGFSLIQDKKIFDKVNRIIYPGNYISGYRYNYLKRFNTIIARILMKIFLMRVFLESNFTDKKVILNNIKNNVFRKLKSRSL